MLFMKFVVQFVNLCSGLVQSFFAHSCDFVDSATVPPNILENGLQQTAAFQAMQQGVESPRSDAIPVVRQLLHHRKPKDGLVGHMDEYMNPYEAEKEFPLVTGHSSTIPLL
jgi:hypothetical protein